MGDARPVVLASCIDESMVPRVLAEEGRRLEAKLVTRAQEEQELLQQLQAVCDELIAVEVELDEVRSANKAAQPAAKVKEAEPEKMNGEEARLRSLLNEDEEEVEADKARLCRLLAGSEEEGAPREDDVAALAGQLRDLKGKLSSANRDEASEEESRVAEAADAVPWRRSVCEACRQRDVAYEWGTWTVWSRWESPAEALPPGLKALAGDAQTLFTDQAARVGVDVAPSRVDEDWIVTEPWHPVAEWDYGDSVEDFVSPSVEPKQQSAAARALGWPPRTLRRRRWERELARRRLPLAGDFANAVLDLKASAAVSQALCAKLVSQLDDLQLALADSDERAARASELEAQVATAEADVRKSRDGLKRAQLLFAASRRTPVTMRRRRSQRVLRRKHSSPSSSPKTAPETPPPPQDVCIAPAPGPATNILGSIGGLLAATSVPRTANAPESRSVEF